MTTRLRCPECGRFSETLTTVRTVDGVNDCCERCYAIHEYYFALYTRQVPRAYTPTLTSSWASPTKRARVANG